MGNFIKLMGSCPKSEQAGLTDWVSVDLNRLVKHCALKLMLYGLTLSPEVKDEIRRSKRRSEARRCG